MAEPEWFRRTTWTPSDEAAFMARLGRSRTEFHRAQYLRIQAHHLAETGDPTLILPALRLLDLLVSAHPDHSQLALAHHQRAQCLVDLGRLPEAIEAFRASMSAQRTLRSIASNAHLDFGELVCALQRTDLYEEVAEAIAEFGAGTPFPVHRYKYAAVRAVLAEARGEFPAATEHAREALAAAAATESPFRRHRSLGLVQFVDPLLLERLRALAA